MLSWLSKSKENKTVVKTSLEKDIKVTFSIVKNEGDEVINKLLREVTVRKDSGNIDEAIELLRKAYENISKTDMIYPVSTFLRLPLYLQQTGKPDEAWREFNKLLKNGCPNQRDSSAKKSDKGAIYDKMRLFLQREKRMNEAVKYGLVYYIFTVSWSYSGMKKAEKDLKDLIKYKDNPLWTKKEFEEHKKMNENIVQNSKEQFETLISKERYTEEAKKLLKKAKKLDKLDEICLLIRNHFKNIPDIKDEEFIEEVNKILK